MRRVLNTFVIVVALSMVGGCAGSESRPKPSASGPLSIELSDGGSSLSFPGRAPWDASFGSAILCTDAGREVILESVKYQARTSPAAITPILRFVPEQGDRTRGGEWEPVGARLGKPGHFVSAPQTLSGTLTNKVKGFAVRGDCGAVPETDSYTELLTVMRIGKSGGWVDGIAITYRSGGKSYKATSNWNYIACGTATAGSDACENG